MSDLLNYFDANPPPINVRRLENLLSEDAGWLTSDEIMNGPLAPVEAELAEQGLDNLDLDLDAMFGQAKAVATAVSSEVGAVAPWQSKDLPLPVSRPLKVAELHRVVMSHFCVQVFGIAGCGKSRFVHEEYLRSNAVRADLGRSILIDCSALRMADPVMFGREAVWSHFGTDDRGFKAFLAGLPTDGTTESALTALVSSHLRGGGVVVFDHAENIDRTGGIDRWLHREFFGALRRVGGRAVFVERSIERGPTFGNEEDAVGWQLDNVGHNEVDAWIDDSLPDHRRAGLTASMVLAITGGRPVLLRDLGLFLYYNPKFVGRAALRAFAQWRSRQGHYSVDCDRLIRAARRHPEVIERALSPGGLDDLWASDSLSAEALEDLCLTGAVTVGKDGRVHFASPLFARRIGALVRPDALTALTYRMDFATLHGRLAWKNLKRCGELASDALAKSIGYENNPVVGLERLLDFLTRWNFSGKIYIRDPDNARLWAPFDRPSCVGPFESWMQPDFAWSAQRGQAYWADDGRIYIPVNSNAGATAMMIVLDFIKKSPPLPCTRRLDVDRVVGLVSGVRPTLAQLNQRIALRRERKFLGRLKFKPPSYGGRGVKHGLLREAGCQSIVVFEKQQGDAAGWRIAKFERTGDGDVDLWWVEGFLESRFDAIIRHPSRHGLVLSGDAVTEAFPRLRSSEAAVYLHPVRRGEEASIVAFLFSGGGVTLDGHVQTQLSAVAPNISMLVD